MRRHRRRSGPNALNGMAVILLALSATSHGYLGADKDECVKSYGEVRHTEVIGGEKSFAFAPMSGRFKGLIVILMMGQDGKAAEVAYKLASGKELGDDVRQTLFKANSPSDEPFIRLAGSA
jgi:hypothetical protein